MSLVAAATIVLAAAAPARLEGVRLARLDARPSLIVESVGNARLVSVHRDGPWARVLLEGMTLGKGFSGSERFVWQRASISAEAAANLPLEALQIRRGEGSVELLLQLPSDVSIEVRQAWQRVALVLRRESALPEGVTVARSLVHPMPAATTPPAPPTDRLPQPLPEAAPALAEEPAAAAPEPAIAEAPTTAAPEVPVASAEPAAAPVADAGEVEPTPALAELEAEPAVAETAGPTPALAEPEAVAPAAEAAAADVAPAAEDWPEGIAPLPSAETVAPRPSAMTEAAPMPPSGPAVAESAVAEPAEATPAPETAELYAQLFPAAPEAAAEAAPAEGASGEAAVSAPGTGGAADTVSLYATLFPGTPQSPEEQPAIETGTGQETWEPSPELLETYQRIFPSAPPPAQPALATVEAPVSDQGIALGFLRFEPALSASYLNADSSVLDTPTPVNDEYFQVQPRLGLSTSDRRLRLSYDPTLRFGAQADVLNSTTHNLEGRLELMLGPRVTLELSDRFVSGILETAIVDPGYEYFFDLARFDRNDFAADASIEMSPRFFVELGGGLGTTRFDESQSGGFFSYDMRRARAGLGFEVTPTLRSVVDYTYDEVPTPDTRPEAESRAHSVNLTLSGDVLPLVTGEIRLGYRNQTNSNAAAGGRSYSGLTASGSLTKLFSPEASLTLWLGRSTPLSRFEENAFYVSNNVQGFLALPLPASLALNAGLGQVWNDYRTPSAELGVPREDRILNWYLGLRRRFGSNLWLSAGYNRQRRRSNLDAFDIDSDGFMLQLDVRFSSFSGGGRR